ncbi:MAG: 4-hydroxy-3-methylbut-2-enyl diphosphate reductase, partial [Acidimicrobiales bacterium]
MKTLLVLAPMRIEALALGPASRSRLQGVDVVVKRTGMGLARAAAAAEAAITCPDQAVALAGLAGGLGAALAPGDVVVADRLIDSHGAQVACLPTAPLLAAELARAGLRARTGTVASTDHIVTGAERARLEALGALAVDMESTAVARRLEMPMAVVRAISDTAGEELFSVAGLRGVARGLGALRAARPALASWAAAAGPREVLLA